MVNVIHGLMQEKLPDIPDNYFSSMVTDPPYGIKFMNKHWDYTIPTVNDWQHALRVLKPGAYGLVACGTRTQHRMVVNLEDAGFEICDVICWHYGQGFPKSINVTNAIKNKKKLNTTRFNGAGTALKPATEFFTLIRKPLTGTQTNNIFVHGCGFLNIDSCRIGFASNTDKNQATWGRGTSIIGGNYIGSHLSNGKTNILPHADGRWPANVILDPFTAGLLDKQSGTLKSGSLNRIYDYKNNGHSFGKAAGSKTKIVNGDTGGASRFFYCAKASRNERNKGLETDNHHPTVKPIKLMRYLIKLITPINGIVLDPYAGSGTTGIAAKLEGYNAMLIEKEHDMVEIAKARINAWKHHKKPHKKQVKLLFDAVN